jgi:hypothetical protein
LSARLCGGCNVVGLRSVVLGDCMGEGSNALHDVSIINIGQKYAAITCDEALARYQQTGLASSEENPASRDRPKIVIIESGQ